MYGEKLVKIIEKGNIVIIIELEIKFETALFFVCCYGCVHHWKFWSLHESCCPHWNGINFVIVFVDNDVLAIETVVWNV